MELCSKSLGMYNLKDSATAAAVDDDDDDM